MFVTTKTHRLAIESLQEAVTLYQGLQRKYNNLVERINDLGGERFLNQARIHPPATAQQALSPEDINCLIRLAHPDRHGGSKIANDMTAKLLTLRR